MSGTIAVPASPAPDLLVVVLATRGAQRLERCLRALPDACAGLRAQTVVCANASDDDVLEVIGRATGAIVMRSTVNLGTGATWNRAVQANPVSRFAIVHEDAEPEPRCLTTLMATLDDRPDVGVVGPRLVTADGDVQAQGWVQWRDGVPWPIGPTSAPELELPDERVPVDFVSSATMVVDRGLWRTVDGFDEGSFPAVTVEIDFCTAAWVLGRQVLAVPAARARHTGGAMVAPRSGWEASAAFRSYLIETNVARYLRRWEELLADHVPSPGAMPDSAAVRKALSRTAAAAAATPQQTPSLPPRERPITADAAPELDAPPQVEERARALIEQRREAFLDWLVADHGRITSELERVARVLADLDGRLRSMTESAEAIETRALGAEAELSLAQAQVDEAEAELHRRDATLTWRLRRRILRLPGVARSVNALGRRDGRTT